MLIQRANKYCAEPTPYQAQAMGQWVGACRWEYNAALERRIFEYENYGFRLDYHGQARELTLERAKRDWLDFAPVHALQYALRHLEDAFARFLSGLNRFPKPRKKFRDVPSPYRPRMSSSSA
jgi:putative transposase